MSFNFWYDRNEDILNTKIPAMLLSGLATLPHAIAAYGLIGLNIAVYIHLKIRGLHPHVLSGNDLQAIMEVFYYDFLIQIYCASISIHFIK